MNRAVISYSKTIALREAQREAKFYKGVSRAELIIILFLVCALWFFGPCACA